MLGLSKKEIDTKYEEIVDFAEVGEFIDTPVQSYSSGMQVRLGFAIATALHPDVLLLDEVLAVGDADFQAKCYHRIGIVLEIGSRHSGLPQPIPNSEDMQLGDPSKQRRKSYRWVPDEILRKYLSEDFESTK